METGDDPAAIQMDVARLLRVLDNLLSDARRHTPFGGASRCRWERGGRTEYEVADTGSGIPADELEHGFERYYRGVEACTRSPSDDTGPGLAVARAIAAAHGGSITATRA